MPGRPSRGPLTGVPARRPGVPGPPGSMLRALGGGIPPITLADELLSAPAFAFAANPWIFGGRSAANEGSDADRIPGIVPSAASAGSLGVTVGPRRPPMPPAAPSVPTVGTVPIVPSVGAVVDMPGRPGNARGRKGLRPGSAGRPGLDSTFARLRGPPVTAGVTPRGLTMPTAAGWGGAVVPIKSWKNLSSSSPCAKVQIPCLRHSPCLKLAQTTVLKFGGNSLAS